MSLLLTDEKDFANIKRSIQRLLDLGYLNLEDCQAIAKAQAEKIVDEGTKPENLRHGAKFWQQLKEEIGV